MTERNAVMYIARKTRENSLLLPGKVVYGLWNRVTGAVCITDDLHEVESRIVRNHEVIRVYADGWELELLGNHGSTAMVHVNRVLYGMIRDM